MFSMHFWFSFVTFPIKSNNLDALEALGFAYELEDLVVEVHKQLPSSRVPHHQRRLQKSCILRGQTFVFDRYKMVDLIGKMGETRWYDRGSSISWSRLDAPLAPPANPKCPLLTCFCTEQFLIIVSVNNMFLHGEILIHSTTGNKVQKRECSSGFAVQDLGLRVYGSGLSVQG